MEVKELLEKGLAEVKTQVDSANEKTAGEVKSLTDQVTELKAQLETAKEAGATKDYAEKMQEQLDALDIKMQKMNKGTSTENVSFDAVFAGMAEEIVEGVGNESKTSTSFKKRFETKAVGNISFPNFANASYGMITTQTLPGIVQAPVTWELYFRNIFPNAQTDSGTIQYLKYTGGEGAAAIWDEKAETLLEKPLVDTDFDKASENVVWIAALANTHRGMLMDAPFLRSFVPNELVYGSRGLFAAENAYIWAKIVANSTAYNGTNTVPVERLYDAAFGQLGDNRFSATHILLNHRDAINLIAFNKAAGSGEYDLPMGAVSVNNGKLYINGVQVIGSPDVPAGKFAAIDNKVGTFFNRMSPEVEVSTEHKDNFSKNLVTFRAEERVALMITNNAGIIYGDLSATTTTTV